MIAKTSQSVAIIGGGLAGLTLARILQVRGVHAVVYERDASRDSASQSKPIDLDPEVAQRAMQAAGLTPVFRSLCRPAGEDLRILDKSAQVWWEEIVPAYARTRPEVDFSRLRDTLIDSLYPTVVQWGHELTHMTAGAQGGHILHFAHGESATAELVVGADGAQSRVRAALSGVEPHYTGISCVEIDLTDAERLYPELAEHVGPGRLVALENNKGLLAQRYANGCIRVYVALRVPQDWHAELPQQPERARAALLAHFSDWAPRLKDLIALCDDTLVVHAVSALPADHRWEPTQGLTLIGDAAHLTSFLTGEGRDEAMLDAVELAEALSQADAHPSALQAFEATMFKRSEDSAMGAQWAVEQCFGDNGAQRLAQSMQQSCTGTMPLQD